MDWRRPFYLMLIVVFPVFAQETGTNTLLLEAQVSSTIKAGEHAVLLAKGPRGWAKAAHLSYMGTAENDQGRWKVENLFNEDIIPEAEKYLLVRESQLWRGRRPRVATRRHLVGSARKRHDMVNNYYSGQARDLQQKQEGFQKTEDVHPVEKTRSDDYELVDVSAWKEKSLQELIPEGIYSSPHGDEFIANQNRQAFLAMADQYAQQLADEKAVSTKLIADVDYQHEANRYGLQATKIWAGSNTMTVTEALMALSNVKSVSVSRDAVSEDEADEEFFDEQMETIPDAPVTEEPSEEMSEVDGEALEELDELEGEEVELEEVDTELEREGEESEENAGDLPAANGEAPAAATVSATEEILTSDSEDIDLETDELSTTEEELEEDDEAAAIDLETSLEEEANDAEEPLEATEDETEPTEEVTANESELDEEIATDEDELEEGVTANEGELSEEVEQEASSEELAAAGEPQAEGVDLNLDEESTLASEESAVAVSKASAPAEVSSDLELSRSWQALGSYGFNLLNNQESKDSDNQQQSFSSLELALAYYPYQMTTWGLEGSLRKSQDGTNLEGENALMDEQSMALAWHTFFPRPLAAVATGYTFLAGASARLSQAKIHFDTTTLSARYQGLLGPGVRGGFIYQWGAHYVLRVLNSIEWMSYKLQDNTPGFPDAVDFAEFRVSLAFGVNF